MSPEERGRGATDHSFPWALSLGRGLPPQGSPGPPITGSAFGLFRGVGLGVETHTGREETEVGRSTYRKQSNRVEGPPKRGRDTHRQAGAWTARPSRGRWAAGGGAGARKTAQLQLHNS